MKNSLLPFLLLFGLGAFANQDVADHDCRVILREARLVGCMRGSCNLMVTIDVKSSLNASAPALFYKAQGSDEIRIGTHLVEVGAPVGYRRFVTDRQSPIAAASTATEVIPFVESDGVTYFDHNALDDVKANYLLIPGIQTYQSKVCQ